MASPTPLPAVHAYLIGGGIASFAAAVFLIRDGGVPGRNISIFEEAGLVGGSLDAAGRAEQGYVLRGGRMMNATYFCTYDLLASIPSVEHPAQSAYDDILAFEQRVTTSAQARLVNGRGEIVDVTSLGLSGKEQQAMEQLMAAAEADLGTQRVDAWFQIEFFSTTFWLLWTTMFSFQPWHSLVEFRRYLLRFLHELPNLGTLAGAERTPYNQFDSVVLPIMTWLRDQGVAFRLSCQVTDLEFVPDADVKTVTAIQYQQGQQQQTQVVQPHDIVLMTNGSMSANVVLGSMTTVPTPRPDADDRAWALWKTVARKYPDFGRPEVFANRPAEATWESFTVTSKGTQFFDLVAQFSGNRAGTGALVSLIDSSWLLSVALPHQPHFLNQPANVTVFWGNALFPDRVGDYVPKRMRDCTGEEILTELLHHLHFSAELPDLLAAANCIPCLLPAISSPLLTRAPGDRPAVVPAGSTNFGFLGQFTEIADDVVFTIEYSVRSAQLAVYTLLKLDRQPPAVYQGQHDAQVLANARQAMQRAGVNEVARPLPADSSRIEAI